MIDVETIFDSDREEYEFMKENKEQTMKEQIEEMKTVINGAFFKDFRNGNGVCIKTISEQLYNAGYRKQEWISVEDRLPERKGRYLVYIPNEQLICCVYYDCDASVYGDNGVTHWMPLPQPPKMKGGAE